MSGDVPAAEALAHVDSIMGRFPGLSTRRFAALAGISESTIRGARKTGRLMPESVECILAVTPRTVRIARPGRDVPVGPLRERVKYLRAVTGGTLFTIARAAGLDESTLHKIMRDQNQKVVRVETYKAILAITEEDVRRQSCWESARATITRLRALQANGWSMTDLAKRLGVVDVSRLATKDPAAPISAGVAARVRRLYEQIGDQPGPGDPRSIRAATRRGFKTPIHYDEHMHLVTVKVDEAQREQESARTALCALALTIEGLSVRQIMTALGCTERRITLARRRAGLVVRTGFDGVLDVSEAMPGTIDAIRAAVRPLHYRSSIDMLDEHGLDYVAILDEVCPDQEESSAAA